MNWAVWISYLAGVGCSERLACVQSQLADVFLARDDEIGHDEGERAGQALAGRHGRANGQQPFGGQGWIVCNLTQYGESHAELAVPGAERKSQWWTRLGRRGRGWKSNIGTFLDANKYNSTLQPPVSGILNESEKSELKQVHLFGVL